MLSSPKRGRSSSEGCDDFPIAVITGGTGIVGSALILQLASDLPSFKLIVLTRRPEQIRSLNVSSVLADIEYPDLGLDPDFRALLGRRTRLIIHCAADTRFNLPIEQSRRTNTEGTRHVLNLAQSCPHLQQFAHISTLYIAGRRKGLVTEGALQHDAGYVNTYEEAKHEAEELVLRRSGLVPVGIYRLSSVIDEAGNSGHLRQLIRFVRWCNQFPFFPADASVPVDLITSKWAARALSALISRHFTPGCFRHICAGEASALPLGTILEAVFKAHEASSDSIVRRPELIPMSRYESLFRHLPRDGGVARAMSSFMTFIPHLSVAQPFDCTFTDKLLQASGVCRPDSNVLHRVLADEFSCAELTA
ncbi:MAG: SDR family oxidoreductase [Bryobacteraceae bacterium]